MKTSQDFNENFNQYSSEIEKEMSNLNRMLQKGSSEYKQAQSIANEIKSLADTDRWNNNSYFDIAFNALGQFISKVQATDGFAAKIAETVDKTMNPYGKKVAFISEKQSWILAVAAVENNITL